MAVPNGKNVLITGAGRGIGRGIALYLAGLGYNIGVHYNSSAEGALSAVEEIRAEGVEAAAIRADLRDLDQIDAMFDAFLEKFCRLDVLVNNSGITQYMPLLEATPEHFDLLTGVDWRATFFCTQRAARLMIRDGVHGSIINTSSVQTQTNHLNAAVYSASKAAISKFTKVAALELAEHRIRVNCVAPGHIKVLDPDVVLPREQEQVARIPWHRVGQAWEIGRLVGFLIDEKSDYITGSEFSCDGGLPLPAMIDNFRFPLPPPSAANLGK